MLVGYEFPGDTNKTLKLVQHDCYWGKVGQLFAAARDRYVAACRFIGFETVVFKRIIKIDGFDHRVLQSAHDKIAAYYRFAHDDGGQMTLFPLEEPVPMFVYNSEKASYEEELLWKWSQFYNKEVKKLAEDDGIAHSILNAILYQNSPKGYEAESLLAEGLEYRYGELRITESEDKLWCSTSTQANRD